MYSQNDETGVLDVLEIRVFFRCPAAMVGNFLDNFLKILSVYFALWWWNLWNFLEKKKKKKGKNFLNSSFSHHQGGSKSPLGNMEL